MGSMSEGGEDRIVSPNTFKRIIVFISWSDAGIME